MQPFGAYFKSTGEGRLLRVAFLALGARNIFYIFIIAIHWELPYPRGTRNVKPPCGRYFKSTLKGSTRSMADAQAYFKVLIHNVYQCIYSYIIRMHYCCCFVSGVGLRPRKYGGGGHASIAGRDLPPAPVCTSLKQTGGIAA